jgi:radical SAM superfamily enzyme YgiQ (UPF0313 family)
MNLEGISCDTLDVRLDQLNEDDCARLNELNVRGLFFGWESGNDRLLKLMRKRLTTELILTKVKMLSKFENLTFWGSGIILLPTETMEETLKTIRFSNRLRSYLPNSTISIFRFMPLPQTDLTRLAIKEGFRLPNDPKGWRIIDPLTRYYESTWIPWMNSELDNTFKYVQEHSRSGIMHYRRSKRLFKDFVLNLIAKSMQKRFESLNFNFLIEPKIYEVLLNFRNLFFKTDYKYLRTEILEK